MRDMFDLGDEAAGAVKSEREKMLAGELYRGMDPALVAERLRTQALVERFNALPAADVHGQGEVLRVLFGHVGAGVVVRPRFQCDYGSQIHVGRETFINFDCVFLDCARIEIGDHCQLGPGVHLYTATHPLDPEPRREGLEYALPIRIGRNVWLGGGTIVCPGIKIGDDTVVGAGSVVTRDLPSGVVAVGNPCRVLRDVRS